MRYVDTAWTWLNRLCYNFHMTWVWSAELYYSLYYHSDPYPNFERRTMAHILLANPRLFCFSSSLRDVISVDFRGWHTLHPWMYSAGSEIQYRLLTRYFCEFNACLSFQERSTSCKSTSAELKVLNLGCSETHVSQTPWNTSSLPGQSRVCHTVYFETLSSIYRF